MSNSIWTKVILGTAFFVLYLGGCAYLNKRLSLENDNEYEQAIEGFIKLNTGVDIDLTPEDI